MAAVLGAVMNMLEPRSISCLTTGSEGDGREFESQMSFLALGPLTKAVEQSDHLVSALTTGLTSFPFTPGAALLLSQ